MKNQKVKSIVIAMSIMLTSSKIYSQHEYGTQQPQDTKKEFNHHVGEPGQGPHKGTIEQAGPFNVEITIKDGMVMLYLLDGNTNAMSNNEVKCQATFLMPDGKSINETLVTIGTEGFLVNNKNLVNYKSCIASFTIKEQTFSATFKNYNSTSGKSMSFVCPIHPEEKSDKPGKCPECGMDLVKAKLKDDHHH